MIPRETNNIKEFSVIKYAEYRQTNWATSCDNKKIQTKIKCSEHTQAQKHKDVGDNTTIQKKRIKKTITSLSNQEPDFDFIKLKYNLEKAYITMKKKIEKFMVTVCSKYSNNHII